MSTSTEGMVASEAQDMGQDGDWETQEKGAQKLPEGHGG